MIINYDYIQCKSRECLCSCDSVDIYYKIIKNVDVFVIALLNFSHIQTLSGTTVADGFLKT